jgi:hypothetical protein
MERRQPPEFADPVQVTHDGVHHPRQPAAPEAAPRGSARRKRPEEAPRTLVIEPTEHQHHGEHRAITDHPRPEIAVVCPHPDSITGILGRAVKVACLL